MPDVKARRGDLVAVVTTTHDYVIGRGAESRERAELGVVTSVTRDGAVKAWRPADSSTARQIRPRERALVVSADRIDVASALASYGARRYPSAPHSSMVPPFDSVDEAREFLRPFLVERAA